MKERPEIVNKDVIFITALAVLRYGSFTISDSDTNITHNN